MTTMTSSEAFVETLVAQRVTDLFGILGSASMDALDLFEPAGRRVVSVAHERAAAHDEQGTPFRRRRPARLLDESEDYT